VEIEREKERGREIEKKLDRERVKGKREKDRGSDFQKKYTSMKEKQQQKLGFNSCVIGKKICVHLCY